MTCESSEELGIAVTARVCVLYSDFSGTIGYPFLGVLNRGRFHGKSVSSTLRVSLRDNPNLIAQRNMVLFGGSAVHLIGCFLLGASRGFWFLALV